MGKFKWVSMLLLAVSCLVMSGCISPHSYVDPQFRKATYDSIHRPAQPISVRVGATFQRNGEAVPRVDGELRGHVERVLRSTGVFASTPADNVPLISVTANNIADVAEAAAKGFGTGLTFGAAGSMVDDNYEFTCVYQGGDAPRSFSYRHAIHTAIGNHTPPAGLLSTTPADAFGRVVEDVLLNFVSDLQAQGVIPAQ